MKPFWRTNISCIARWFCSISIVLLLSTSVNVVHGFSFLLSPKASIGSAINPRFPSSRLHNHHVAAEAPAAAEHVAHQSSNVMIKAAASVDYSILNGIVSPTFFWSAAIMVSIVALLYSWEEAVHNARHRLPPTILPVLDSMLAEMGGLGFIGLFLSIVVTDQNSPANGFVSELSETFLGEEEILLESFEFLHTAFFEVGIGFFVITGLTVLAVLKEIESLEQFSMTVLDTDGDGDVSLDELADALNVESFVVDLDGDGNIDEEEIRQALRRVPVPSLWDEVTLNTAKVTAEALVLRERLIQTRQVDPSFRIDLYFSKIFGERLEEIVELSPLTWLPLIPIISIGQSVDLSNEIVSASSPNAAESCGLFLTTGSYLWSSTALCLLSIVWGVWNYVKMTSIKNMLMPTLVRDTSLNNGRATLLPPKYQDAELLSEFNSSPGIFGWIESFWGRPARNAQEKLFGAAGRRAPIIYLTSIRLQIWLLIAQIVFWGSQIVTRDINVLVNADKLMPMAGNAEAVPAELALYGFFVSLAIGQLLLAPRTFLNFCLVTSIEDLVSMEAIEESVVIRENNIKRKLDAVTGDGRNSTLVTSPK